MRRLRLVLLVVAVLSTVIVALLSLQTWSSMKQERLLFHQVIAQDIYDTIETQLAIFIREEEDRPFSHYNYYYVPEGQVQGSVGLYRSPIADLPKQSPIVAYFQIDAENELEFPHIDNQLKNQETPVDIHCFNVCTQVGDVLKEVNLYSDSEADNEGKNVQQQFSVASSNWAEQVENVEIQSLSNQSNLPVVVRNGASGPAQKGMIFGSRGNKSSLTKNYNRRQQSKIDSSSYFLNTSDDNQVYQQLSTYNDIQANNNDEETVVENSPEQVQGQVSTLNPQLVEQQLADVAAKNPGQGPSLDVKMSPISTFARSGDHMILYRNALIAEESFKQGFVLDSKLLQQQLLQGARQQSQHADMWKLHWLSEAQESYDGLLPDDHYGFYYRLEQPFQDLQLLIDLQPVPADFAFSSVGLFTMIGLSFVGLLIALWLINRLVVLMQRYVQRRQDFVAAVSHELKTPLTAIRMHAEMLEAAMVPTDEKRQEYYTTIHAESQRLTRLIDNVLTLSRLEQDEYNLQLVMGDLRAVVEEAVSMLRPHAQQQGFQIECVCDDDLPALRFERDAVIQILVNCIDNAIKFSQQAETKLVQVQLHKQEHNVLLSVRDFGPGVPHDQQAHIFESFYRGERELTRQTKGTGIGLSLVHKLAAAMDAGVEVCNHKEGGFQISLLMPVQ